MNPFEDAKQVSMGMRVITVTGDRTGVVRARSVALNKIGILYDGEDNVTPMLDPWLFKPSPDPNLRLIRKPPAETVPRSPKS